ALEHVVVVRAQCGMRVPVGGHGASWSTSGDAEYRTGGAVSDLPPPCAVAAQRSYVWAMCDASDGDGSDLWRGAASCSLPTSSPVRPVRGWLARLFLIIVPSLRGECRALRCTSNLAHTSDQRRAPMSQRSNFSRRALLGSLAAAGAPCAAPAAASPSAPRPLCAARAAPCGARRPFLPPPTTGAPPCLSDRTSPVGPCSAPSPLPAPSVRPRAPEHPPAVDAPVHEAAPR